MMMTRQIVWVMMLERGVEGNGSSTVGQQCSTVLHSSSDMGGGKEEVWYSLRRVLKDLIIALPEETGG